jgi:NTE family protein
LKLHEIPKVKSEYDKLIQKYGAQILSVTRIIRSEVESPTILKNADFSPKAIKGLIAQGEQKALEKIDKLRFFNP